MKMQFVYLCFLSIFIMFSATYSQTILDFKVNDGERDEGGCPSITTDANGNFVITWWEHYHSDMGCSYNLYAQRYSSDGIAVGGNFKVNDKPGSANPSYAPTPRPAISSDNGGNFIITWWHDRNYDDNYDIYAQRYTSDGTAIGANFKVNTDTGSVGQFSPSISTDGSGNYVITWYDSRNGEGDIYAQRYSNNGEALGSNFKVNADTGNAFLGFDLHQPSISSDDIGNFVITWYDTRNGYGDIYAQRFSSDGTSLGSSFQVNDVEGVDWDGTSIAMAGNGDFVITWTEVHNYRPEAIYARRFSSDGTSLGSSFQVNDVEGVILDGTSIAMAGNGDFVITWTEEHMESLHKICAQRYSSDGNAIGINFMVTYLGEKSDVDLRNDRVYTTWQDNRGNEDGLDVWANVLDWDNPVGIDDKDMPQMPSAYQLSQNYPNPFNPSTIINYELPTTNYVELNIYNLLGQKVATLVNERQQTGSHQVEWDAGQLSSGIYYYRIEAGDFQDVKKMILLR